MQSKQTSSEQTSLKQMFRSATNEVIQDIVPEDADYKLKSGTVLYDFVQKLVGDVKAPKITGMLIDLPVTEIQ